MKVYCEHHALRKWLKELQNEGRIILFLFPYDQTAKQINGVATPSEATWEELKIPWNKLNFSWVAFSPSSHYSEISTIIGEANIRDAKHIDSAFKTKCQCMFTCDNGILSKSQELEKLLTIKFFHPDKQKEEFMEFLEQLEQKVSK